MGQGVPRGLIPDGSTSGSAGLRGLRSGAMAAVLVAGMLPAGSGTTLAQLAQDTCLAEVEPNDTPEEAISTSGSVCITGELPDGDQDLFLWEVPEQAAATRWTFGVEGIPGTLTGLKVFRVDSAPGEEPVAVERTPWLDIESGPSEPAEGLLADVLLPVGRYLLGISRSESADGSVPTSLAYSFRVISDPPWPPHADIEPNDDPSTAGPIGDGFEIGGDLVGSADLFAWTVTLPGLHWDLAARVPLGLPVWLELARADGTALARISTDTSASLFDLALEPGGYVVRVGPASDASRPYVLSASPSALEADPEPNDEAATAVPLLDGQAIRGRLAAAGDRDRYQLHVAPGDRRLRDVRLLWRSDLERSLCLIGADGRDVVCRSGAGGVSIADLLLAPGRHDLEVRGRSDPQEPYLLRVDTTTLSVADFEAEPNDTPVMATPMDPTVGMRGRSTGAEDDHFSLQVTGEPQLWQVEASGRGIMLLDWVSPAGGQLAQGEVDQDRTKGRLTDLYLVPGRHIFRLRVSDADYRLQATPLGPPDPDAEREPNSDMVRAEAYRIGERRVGRLATLTDRDLYRFTVAANDRLRLHLAQPPDARIALRLTTGDETIGDVRDRPEGEPFGWDLLLLPGDHVLELWPEQASEGHYELTSERQDPFDVSADQEPNGGPGFAREVPADLSWSGSAMTRSDEDWYRLPAPERDAPLRIHLEGEGARARLQDLSGQRVDLMPQDDGSLLSPSLAAGTPLLLMVTADRDYRVRLESDGLSAAAPEEGLALDMALQTVERTIAAYWPDAQLLEAELIAHNRSGEAVSVDLEVRTSHYLWSVQPATTTLEVPADGSITLPLVIRVEPDAWAGEPVRISLRASDRDGRRATAMIEMEASADAAPLGIQPGWGVPDALLGGLDVAALALGAQPGGTLDPAREAELFDGVTPSGAGFGWSIQSLPLELSVDLAGDDPLPIVGTIINPQARDGRLSQKPRSFELLLSEDGEEWIAALRGELSSLPIDQAFVLPEPISARHARLRILDMYGDRAGFLALGEWKVIASPGVVTDEWTTDIAAAGRGGHVVTFDPFSGKDQPARMLDDERRREELYLRDGQRFDMVLGFHAGRAALVTHIDWLDPDGSTPDRRLDSVEVSISSDSPMGPWRHLGTWSLERDSDGLVGPFTLPTASWTRYLRLEADPGPEVRSLEAPGRIMVHEAATGPDYRSILGEWGYPTSRGPLEWLSETDAQPDATLGQAGGDRSSATPLDLGAVVHGRVVRNVNEDWYRVTIPAGHNMLEVVLGGRPSVRARLALFDVDGEQRPMAFAPTEDGSMRYEAAVEAGAVYFLRVDQPPFSVVFAFDTSGSMGPFLDFVLEGVRSFAAGVERGREAVMLLPFEEPPILSTWEDDAVLLQSAMGAWTPSGSGSSSAEIGLIDAAGRLVEREGARAILLVTDAETSSYDRTPELWEALAAVRPIIFSVHVGGASEPVFSRQLMQAWAASSGGHYAYPTTHGEMTRAFERMAASLRRPALYSLRATTSELVLVPGSIAVLPAPDGSRPGFASGIGVGVILDTSGSMLEKLQGRRRIDVATDALERLVSDALIEGVPFTMRTFGGRGKGKAARCETRLSLPLGPLEKASALGMLGKLKARKQTRTPIAAALEKVPEDLAGVTGPRIVVLVTDGAETCGGDPEAVIDALREGGLDVTVNIVGFALEDEALKSSMAGWAADGGGTYFDAAGADSLADSIAAAVNAPYRVYDPAGKVVAGGTVGGGAVALDPGAYRVEVLVEPPVVFREVMVGSGDRVQLTLPAAGQEP